MDLSNIDSNEKNKEIKIKTNLQSIKSNFILKKIHSYLKQSKSLDIIRYNKKLQKRLNFTFKNYKDFSEIFTPIEIEIMNMMITKYYLLKIDMENLLILKKQKMSLIFIYILILVIKKEKEVISIIKK